LSYPNAKDCVFFDVLQSFLDEIWRIFRNIMNIRLQNAIFLMNLVNLSIFLCIFAPMKLLNKKNETVYIFLLCFYLHSIGFLQ